MSSDARTRIAALPAHMSPFARRARTFLELVDAGEGENINAAKAALDLLTRVVDGLLNIYQVPIPWEFWKRIETLQNQVKLPAEVIALMHAVRREVRKVTHPMPNQPVPSIGVATDALVELIEWVSSYSVQHSVRICYACSAAASMEAAFCPNPQCSRKLDDGELDSSAVTAIPWAEPHATTSPASFDMLPAVQDPHQSSDSLSAIQARLDARAGESSATSTLGTAIEEAQAKQRRMLPDPPTVDGLEIAVVYAPAEVISADFYDFMHKSDQRLVVILGSVSTSGVEAWGDMTLALKTMRIHARRIQTPLEILDVSYEDLATDLVDNKTLITALVGVIDLQSFNLKLARAGQPPLILFNPGRKPDPIVKLAPGGKPMGPADDPMTRGFKEALEQVDVQLYLGDTLVWYSPGVPNATDASGGSLGMDGISWLLDQYKGGSASDLAQHLFQGIATFRGGRPQDTDYSLIVVRLC